MDNTMDIASVLKKAKDGDSLSMDFILKTFKPKVNAICREYFLIGSDFDDILQEGMIGLYKAIQNYDETKNDSFSRFASLCIHRQIQSAVKVANSKKNLPLNDYFSINTIGEVDGEGEKKPQIILVTKDRVVEKVSLEKEKNSTMLQKIKSVLNEKQFNILLLYLDGYSYQEIANMLDLKTKTIDNTIQAIKKKLKNVLTDLN